MNKGRQIFLHIISWVSILLFFLFAGSKAFIFRFDLVVMVVFFGVINIGIFYANYLYLLPCFLSRKKYLPFVLGLAGLLLIAGLMKYGMALYFKDIVLMRGGRGHRPLSFGEYYTGTLFVSAFFVFLSSAVRFAGDWFMNEKLRKNLEKEKLLAELAFLRSQINPHFLFNSLNNIYSLAYQKSERAPEAILKLSEIMRYMLDESNEHQVTLSKEIRYLENFIALQKLRFKEGAFVEMQVKGEEYKNQHIAPLILIPFVENAFKHGEAGDPLHPIKINLMMEQDKLRFTICNKKRMQFKDETSGIGMNNVKRRLDLLYPGKYTLEISDSSCFYNCQLSLAL